MKKYYCGNCEKPFFDGQHPCLDYGALDVREEVSVSDEGAAMENLSIKREISIQDGAKAEEDLRINARSLATNRLTKAADTQNPPDTKRLHGLIVDFVEKGNSEALEQFITPLVPLVRTVDARLNLPTNTFFRGLPQAIENELKCKRIGPPNPLRENRYNYGDERHLKS